MKNISSCLVLILFVLFLNGQKVPKLYKQCLPSIVRISVVHYNGIVSQATGFFINKNTIATCYHLLENAKLIEIYSHDGKKYTIDSILASNRKTDLVKFLIKEKNQTWLELCNKLPEIGESVFLIGNPEGFDFSISNGIVSGIRIKDSVQVIQNTAPSSSGNSGSPLLNKRGKVIGIMTSVKFIGQNINFASTSIDMINIENDKSIQKIFSVAEKMSKREIDSIVFISKKLYDLKQFKNALATIIPVIKFADTSQSIEYTEFMADCYFYSEEYSDALQYYNALINTLIRLNLHSKENYYTYSYTMFKASACYFILGDINSAIQYISKSAEFCKRGLDLDSKLKEQYKLLIQQVYVADATYKAAENKSFDACISWNLAKQYGYTNENKDLDDMCK